MSRAFVREEDQQAAAETLPELAISPHPNLVTPTGLQKIVAKIDELERERQLAQHAADTHALARIARDLRYWTQRRATARVVPVSADLEQVRFGVLIRLRLEDGQEQTLRLVGEDEADPANGLVNWLSPVGQALIGHATGDTVELFGQRAEILDLEA